HRRATTHTSSLSLHDALPISVDRAQRRIRQWARVQRSQPVEYLLFARRGERLGRLLCLGAPDLLGVASPLADQRHDALVEIIDRDRKSTRLNSSHGSISYAVF